MATHLHYDGTTVELDSQWAHDWYVLKLGEYFDEASKSGAFWAWFWTDQQRNRTFHFRLTPQTSVALSYDGSDGVAGTDPITDLSVHN